MNNEYSNILNTNKILNKNNVNNLSRVNSIQNLKNYKNSNSIPKNKSLLKKSKSFSSQHYKTSKFISTNQKPKQTNPVNNIFQSFKLYDEINTSLQNLNDSKEKIKINLLQDSIDNNNNYQNTIINSNSFRSPTEIKNNCNLSPEKNILIINSPKNNYYFSGKDDLFERIIKDNKLTKNFEPQNSDRIKYIDSYNFSEKNISDSKRKISDEYVYKFDRQNTKVNNKNFYINYQNIDEIKKNLQNSFEINGFPINEDKENQKNIKFNNPKSSPKSRNNQAYNLKINSKESKSHRNVNNIISSNESFRNSKEKYKKIGYNISNLISSNISEVNLDNQNKNPRKSQESISNKKLSDFNKSHKKSRESITYTNLSDLNKRSISKDNSFKSRLDFNERKTSDVIFNNTSDLNKSRVSNENNFINKNYNSCDISFLVVDDNKHIRLAIKNNLIKALFLYNPNLSY